MIRIRELVYGAALSVAALSSVSCDSPQNLSRGDGVTLNRYSSQRKEADNEKLKAREKYSSGEIIEKIGPFMHLP
jgi:hypothetical protein